MYLLLKVTLEVFTLNFWKIVYLFVGLKCQDFLPLQFVAKLP